MNIILVLLTGFLVVAIFDAIGAILSRLLNFNYAILTIGSIIIYGLVAIYSAKVSNTITGIMSCGIIGVFDAIFGSLISKKLKAKIPKIEGVEFEISHKLIISMFFFGCLIGLITLNIFG